MKQLRITNGFDRMSDANLQVRTGQIIDCLTINFATAPGLPGLVAANDEYALALSKAIGGGIVEKAVKNQKKEEVVFQHHQMIAYVTLTCAGDRVMAAKSGYTLAKEPAPQVLTQPGNLVVTNGPNAGELELVFDNVKAKVSYIYQCAKEPFGENSDWQSFNGNKCKYLFTGWKRANGIG